MRVVPSKYPRMSQEMIDEILASGWKPQELIDFLQRQTDEQYDLIAREPWDVLECLNFMLPGAEENIDEWITLHPESIKHAEALELLKIATGEAMEEERAEMEGEEDEF